MTRLLTETEQDIVIECLCDGLGAEDIAVLHGMPAASVREFIADLREHDTISEIYTSKGGRK